MRRSALRLGRVVRVVRAADEVFDHDYLGKYGVVVRLDAVSVVGETAEEPGVHLRFPNGKTDLFWREELAAVRS